MLTEAIFFHLMLPRVTKKNLYICIFQNFSNKKLESSTPIILNDGILESGINSFQVTFFSQKLHIFNL
jgi:hypothetical protein